MGNFCWSQFLVNVEDIRIVIILFIVIIVFIICYIFVSVVNIV